MKWSHDMVLASMLEIFACFEGGSSEVKRERRALVAQTDSDIEVGYLCRVRGKNWFRGSCRPLDILVEWAPYEALMKRRREKYSACRTTETKLLVLWFDTLCCMSCPNFKSRLHFPLVQRSLLEGIQVTRSKTWTFLIHPSILLLVSPPVRPAKHREEIATTAFESYQRGCQDRAADTFQGNEAPTHLP